jgi:hypothetical protein
MRRPFAAVVIVAAIVGAPLAAQAMPVGHHQKLSHIAFHRSIRAADAVDSARVTQTTPVGHWCIATNIAGAGACWGAAQDRLFSNGS